MVSSFIVFSAFLMWDDFNGLMQSKHILLQNYKLLVHALMLFVVGYLYLFV